MPFSFTVAESQYNEIISSPDAWVIPSDDDDVDVDGTIETNSEPADLKTTNSARRVKALIEGVTGVFFLSLSSSLLL